MPNGRPPMDLPNTIPTKLCGYSERRRLPPSLSSRRFGFEDPHPIAFCKHPGVLPGDDDQAQIRSSSYAEHSATDLRDQGHRVGNAVYAERHLDLRHLLLHAHRPQHEALEHIVQIIERVISPQICHVHSSVVSMLVTLPPE